jgi:hypothetical protein
MGSAAARSANAGGRGALPRDRRRTSQDFFLHMFDARSVHFRDKGALFALLEV